MTLRFKYITLSAGLALGLLVLFSCEDNEQGVSPDIVLSAVIENELEEVEGRSQTFKITLVKPTVQEGTITVNLSSNDDVVYGEDYETDPAAVSGVITLAVPAGTQQASFSIESILEENVNPSKTINFEMNASGGVAFGTQDFGSITFINKPELFLVGSLTNFGDVFELETSGSQGFQVTGRGLTDDLVIEAPPQFQVSADDSDFDDEISFSREEVDGDTVAVFVRFTPGFDVLGAINGNLVLTSENADDLSLNVEGSGVIQPPTILLEEELNPFDPTLIDTTSIVQVYSVGGYRLTEDITVMAPPSFQLSLDSLDYSQSLSLDFETINSLEFIRVYARFAPGAGDNGVLTGDISHSSSGAVTQDLTISSVALEVIAGTSFEEPAGLDVDYTDTGDPDLNRELINNVDEAPIQFSSVGGEIGFRTFYVSTGGVGATDGDDLGVTTKTSIVGTFSDGVQGYYADDTDGIMSIVFDPVDASTFSALKISVDYLFNPTDYEEDDYFELIVESGSGVPVAIYTVSGADIEEQGLDDGIWKNIVLDVTSLVEDEAILKIQISTDSNAEEIYIDNIQFQGG